MFSLFKKKTSIDKLQEKYDRLLKEAHRLSTINRSQSDEKVAEAEAVNKQIEALLKQQS